MVQNQGAITHILIQEQNNNQLQFPSNIEANNVQKEIKTFKVNMSLSKKGITLPLNVHIKLDS